MADVLLFGRLADTRRARLRRFRCFDAHLMHTVIFGLQGKLVGNTSLSLLNLFLLDRCTTSETFHDMQITVARATQLC